MEPAQRGRAKGGKNTTTIENTCRMEALAILSLGLQLNFIANPFSFIPALVVYDGSHIDVVNMRVLRVALESSVKYSALVLV